MQANTLIPNHLSLHPAAQVGLGPDPFEQMALADRDDWMLLRLVLSAAMSIFVLALASSLHA